MVQQVTRPKNKVKRKKKVRSGSGKKSRLCGVSSHVWDEQKIQLIETRSRKATNYNLNNLDFIR